MQACKRLVKLPKFDSLEQTRSSRKTYLVKFTQTLQSSHLRPLLKVFKAYHTFCRLSPFAYTVLFCGQVGDHACHSPSLTAHSPESVLAAVTVPRILASSSLTPLAVALARSGSAR